MLNQKRNTPAKSRMAKFKKAKTTRKSKLPKSKTEGVSRLEARIPTNVYLDAERAAKLRGLTLTAFVTATISEAAHRTIEETSIIRLARADQIAFAEALANPPEPNARLRTAKRRHAELTGK